MNERLEPLVKELAEAHRRSLRGEDLAPEIERRLAARGGGPAGRGRAARRVALVVALGGAAAVVAWRSAARAPVVSAPPALTVAIGRAAGAVGAQFAEGEARFSDGSSVSVAGGRARVDALDADGATLTLHEGRLDAHVVHAARTRWVVRAGGYAIRVVGTRFAVTWAPGAGALNVRLFEGAVEVSGPGLPATRVAAGQRLEVASTGAHLVPDALDEAPSVDEPLAPPLPPPPRNAPRAGNGEPWRELAAGGRYREALASLGAGFAARCRTLGGEDVVWLGDVARLAGDAERATQAYESALRRFPRQDRPVFALGQLAFDVRHDYREAARWFARYLDAHARGPLAAEAAGRLLESWQRAGDEAAARVAAASYLERYPSGAQAGLARQVLGR
jgi:hypothetical protein